MSTDERPRPSVGDILKLAGGVPAIAAASDGRLTTDAVYKWPKIGIPDRHWPHLIDLARARGAIVTPDDLMSANIAARGPTESAA